MFKTYCIRKNKNTMCLISVFVIKVQFNGIKSIFSIIVCKSLGWTSWDNSGFALGLMVYLFPGEVSVNTLVCERQGSLIGDHSTLPTQIALVFLSRKHPKPAWVYLASSDLHLQWQFSTFGS